MKTVNILGVNISALDFEQNLETALGFLKENPPAGRMIFTPNPEVLTLARRDAEYRNILNAGDLVTADGIGIIAASVILGKKIPGRTTGVELITAMLSKMAENGGSVYLLGGKEGVAEKAARNIEKQFPGVAVLGAAHGYFDDVGERAVISEINKKTPDLLLVGLGFPRQERRIYANRKNLNVKAAIACGGTLDILSGQTKRAPSFIRKIGCEWLYRLIKEPKRFFRMLALPKFLVLAIGERMGFPAKN